MSTKKKSAASSSATTDVPEKVEERAADGTKAFKNGNYGIAIACYSEALKLLGTRNSNLRATIMSNRSSAYLRMADYKKAHQDALSAVELRVDWFKGYYRMGEVLLETGDYVGASQAYGRAVSLHPGDANLQAKYSEAMELVDLQRKGPGDFWRTAASGAGLGFGLMVLLVAIHSFTSSETNELASHIGVVVSGTMLGALVGVVYRMYTQVQLEQRLKPKAARRVEAAEADQSSGATEDDGQQPQERSGGGSRRVRSTNKSVRNRGANKGMPSRPPKLG